MIGRMRKSWNPPSESADAALLPNFSCGNARADDLVRNNGYAANAVQLHQDHIVGSFFRLSYRPSWRYLGINEEDSRAFSRDVEAAWNEYAEDDFCGIDAERKRTFTMMIREGVAMAVSYKGMYGDVAIVVYSGQYIENDAKKNYLPDLTMVLGNTQARGLRTYGCILDADAQREGINASTRYPKNWVQTGDPAREFTMPALVCFLLQQKEVQQDCK